MSRLLSGARVGAEPRPLRVPDPADDPFTQRRVDEASAAAYERGVADGRRQAVEEARAAAEEASGRAVAAVRDAAREVLAEMGALRAEEAAADVTLACRIAEVVLGREPHDEGRALLERCRAALAALDDAPLTVRVSPSDAAVLREGLAADADAEVVEDGSLGPGEARIRGPWSQADLTRDAAWQLVREALGAGDG